MTVLIKPFLANELLRMIERLHCNSGPPDRN